MVTLRQALQAITDQETVKDHIKQIHGLMGQYPHQIILVDEPPKEYNFTCFEFAFGIYDYQDYINLKLYLWNRGIQDVFANSRFIQWLIQNELLTTGNEIILYLDDKKPKHAGIVKDGLVVSKWGIGNVYQHSIFETPESYGEEILFFSDIGSIKIFTLFKRWIDELGV